MMQRKHGKLIPDSWERIHQFERTVQAALEDTRHRLNILAAQRHLKLKVDEYPVDNNTLKFRIWIFPNNPDAEIIGTLKRLGETQTLISGEAKIGVVTYVLWPILVVFFFILSLLTFEYSLESGAIGLLAPAAFGFIWYQRLKSRDNLLKIVEDTLTSSNVDKQSNLTENPLP